MATSKTISPDEIEIALEEVTLPEIPHILAEPQPAVINPKAGDPFRILIIGDFSGDADSRRKPQRIDRGGIDDALQILRPRVDLILETEAAAPVSIEFRQLSDFEPDRIFERCNLFRAVVESASPRPEREIGSRAQEAETELRRLASGGLLDEIGGSVPGAANQSPDELDAIIERIIVPGLIQRESTDSLQLAAERELRMSVLGRAILHHPKFQSLESAWRSLDLLVRRVDHNERLKLCILDVSKEKLVADLLEAEHFRSSDIYKIVVRDTVQRDSGERWAVIVGNYGFDRTHSEDVELLERLGLLARAAGAPFIAECLPSPNGSTDSAAWHALRKSSTATWIGLAVPRILLRVPYGKETRSIKAFDFEEVPGEPKLQDYLWGNPAFACACLLANAFSEFGWSLQPGLPAQLDDLPFHTFRVGGETRTQPPAQVLLSDEDSTLLAQQGLMPFIAFRNRDFIRLSQFRSIADPPERLSGAWNAR